MRFCLLYPTFASFLILSHAVVGLPVKKAVKIAVIGNIPPHLNQGLQDKQVIDKVTSFWQSELKQVLPDKPDLVVIPEACDRPQGWRGDRLWRYYRARGDSIELFFRKVARENKMYVVYPAVRKLQDGRWYNTIAFIDREGKVLGYYKKNFPTIGEIEQGISPGKEPVVISCDFGKVGFAICFDLNFDELLYGYAKLKPDLIIFCSMYHGGLRQAQWAYTCRAHFVGGILRSCPSQIRDPLGRVLASTTNYFDYAVKEVVLDCAPVHLDFNWSRLKALKKKYGSKVSISDPGLVGAVLITSLHPKLSVDEMLHEFGIEKLDHYFNRARKVRENALKGKK